MSRTELHPGPFETSCQLARKLRPCLARGTPRAHGIMRNTAGRQCHNITAIRRITMFLKRAHISRWPGYGLLLRRIGQKPGRPRGPPAPGVPLPAVRWRVFP